MFRSRDSFVIVCFLMQLLGCLCQRSSGTLPHLVRETVSVRLHLNYHQANCLAASDHTNVSIGTIDLPQEHALLLNALEFASDKFSEKLVSFELVYISQVGYSVLAFNGLASSLECAWTMVTVDPPISLSPVNIGPTGTSINDVYVSNFGMEVFFTYGLTGNGNPFISVHDLLAGHVPWPIVEPPANIVIDNPMKITYNVSFPLHPTCRQPAASGFSGITLPLNISSGQTALNVVEKAADLNRDLTFTVINYYGVAYYIRSINTATQAGACKWCVKYSPTVDGSVPGYALTVPLNDFTIPVDKGMLILEYTTECSTAQESLSRGIITEEVSRRARMSWRQEEYSVLRIAVGVVVGLIVVGAVTIAWHYCCTAGHGKQS